MPDFSTSRNSLLNHLAELASATGQPLSADLEDGFGTSPEDVADTVQLAAATGEVGASADDHCGIAGAPLAELAKAVDRVRAAVDSARRLPFPFLVTARAENFLLQKPDLATTIKRLQHYQEADADVLFAPGITDLQHIATLVRSVDRPVNVLISVPGMIAKV